MVKLSIDSVVPENHCREAAQAYWRVRYLDQAGSSEEVQDLLATYEPWLVELESDESFEETLGLSPVGECVYATIHDAILANYSDLTSPGLVFRGHADTRWDLLTTRLRIKAPETIAFYEGHKNTFIAECRRIVPDATDLHLEAVCQHYGFPTCLLDLTESFEVAAFFATHSSWSGDLVDRYRNIGCVWIFPQELLDKEGGFVSAELMAPCLISNQRLVRQRGALVDIPSADKARELRALGRAVVFSRMGQVEPRFRGQGAELTRVYLFPPDEDDDIGEAARPHVDAIHGRAGFLRALDGCFAELELSEFTRRERFFAAFDSPRDDLSMLLNAWDRSETLWALEYSTTNNKIDLTRKIMSSGHLNLFDSSTWHDLLCEFVLSYLGEENQMQAYCSEDDLVDLVLISLNKGLVSIDFVVRLLEIVGNQCHVLSESLRRKIVSAIHDDSLIEYGITDSLDALQALCAWYWAETDSEIRGQIETLIRDSGDLRDHLTNWPPCLTRCAYVHPTWTFSSDMMVWGLDTVEATKRIAAVSSDHNLYLLDFEGGRRARLDLLAPGRSVRFLNEKRLVASNAAGTALWLDVGEDSDSLAIDCKQCLMDGWEGESCDVNLDVTQDGSRVIAGYGSSRSNTGGIAVFNDRGELLWRVALEGRVREVSFWDSSFRSVGTGWRANGQMYAFLIDEEQRLHELCHGQLVHLAGFSSTRKNMLLSVRRDTHLYHLVEYSLDGRANLLLESDRMTWQAFRSDHHGFLISTNNALSEPPRADVAMHSGDGRVMWRYEVPRQAMQLLVDEKGERIYFSGQGQGNVYALSLSGSLLFCSRVKHAPLCFSLSKKFGTLFVGSKTIAAIPVR